MYLKLTSFSFAPINFHIFQCSNIAGVLISRFVFKYDWSRCAQFSFFSRHLIFSYMSNSSTIAEKIALFGRPRGTVNWRCIFQCDCCKLENDDDIPRTLPDLSIIYKLHLESRKLINMYDWLQVTIRPALMFTG